MKCADLEELLSAFVDGELAQTQREFILGHLAGCAECQAKVSDLKRIGGQLSSLQATALLADVKEATMSKIRTETALRKTRKWLRPALVGTAAILTVFVLSIFLVLPGRAPQDILAQALNNTQNLSSYRIKGSLEYREPGTSEWIPSVNYEVERAGPARFRTKSTLFPFYRFYSQRQGDWEPYAVSETIISDNSVYNWGSTPSRPVSLEQIEDSWNQDIANIQQPMDSFKLLADIDRMPDEVIDSTRCLHYRGAVDMDAWIEKRLAEEDKHGSGSSSALSYAQRIEELRDVWRNKQIELEFWVGANDYLVHQWRKTENEVPASFWDKRDTIRYSDFDQEIVVEEPLDADGNLLPDWWLQDERFFSK